MGMEDWAAVLDKSIQVSSAETVLRDLAPALYHVRLGDLGDRCYQPSETTLDLAQGAPAEPFTLRVAAAGSIRGKLTGAVNPAGLVVALLPSDPAEAVPTVQFSLPDSEGRFAFSPLRPAKYRIAVQPAGAPKSRWISGFLPHD